MKLIALGDIHGRDKWKKIPMEQFDKVVFIGDYFDSQEIPFSLQMDNFLKIKKFKRKYPKKVILICGNHDYHYLKGVTESYSGFQEVHSFDISNELEDLYKNKELQACFIFENNLFTHAGVSKTWCKTHGIDLENISQSINEKFWGNLKHFEFQGRDPYGNNITQSPIWIRPESLNTDRIDNFTQIVGHTSSYVLTNNDSGLFFIDVNAFTNQYLVIIDGEYNVVNFEG